MGRYSRLHPKVTMRFSVGLCALASGVLAAPAQVDSGISVDVPTTDYDAVIVGGGPAGLSALSALARVRRNVLMVDSGEYRNQPTRHMHDVIGFDGVTPAYYRWAAREQISHYDTVSMTNGTVSSIVSQENNTWFTVNIDESEPVTARKIVLATGLRDLLPDTPGVKENWGNGIFWCPWCDGHEHADQGLGLIASLPEIPGLVREMLTLNEDIVALVNGTDTPEMREEAEKELPKWEEYLKLHNVTIQNGTIAAIRRLENATSGDPSLPTYPEHDLFRVDFEGGKSIERNAFLTSYEDEQMSWVGPEMGVRLDGGRLAADPTKGLMTNIPGVYAIGDANADNVTNVPHALFSGKRTAVFVHVQLERETQAEELANLPDEGTPLVERTSELDERAIWERMNGEPGEILYAGEYGS